jgi:hypothetical protein
MGFAERLLAGLAGKGGLAVEPKLVVAKGHSEGVCRSVW